MNIQHMKYLYEKNNIFSMKDIVDLGPNEPFNILYENYGNMRYRIPKFQTVTHMPQKTSGVISKTVNLV